jgi:hypothetical protein
VTEPFARFLNFSLKIKIVAFEVRELFSLALNKKEMSIILLVSANGTVDFQIISNQSKKSQQ